MGTNNRLDETRASKNSNHLKNQNWKTGKTHQHINCNGDTKKQLSEQQKAKAVKEIIQVETVIF